MKRIIKKIMSYFFGVMQSAYYAERYENFKRKYSIKSDFRFNGRDIRIYGDGEIVVGHNSYIGNYSTIQLTKGFKVIIGNNCQISHNVRMYTSSADPDQDFTREKTKPGKSGSIIVGDGVWIGANVFINPGVSIGSNAVIGANSVVTKDIPESAIVGGVPAKNIRYKNY